MHGSGRGAAWAGCIGGVSSSRRAGGGVALTTEAVGAVGFAE